ncbi:MAG: hypothetical protein ABEI13_00595, partial [Candidatus Paceibacteria bacterium]
MWSKRGWEIRREDGLIHVRSAESNKTIQIIAAGEQISELNFEEPIDVIVSVHEGTFDHQLANRYDAKLIEASDLYLMIKYAITRDMCKKLLVTHFNQQLLENNNSKLLDIKWQPSSALVILILVVVTGTVFGLLENSTEWSDDLEISQQVVDTTSQDQNV